MSDPKLILAAEEIKAVLRKVSDYLARIGAKGGKATGASKRRGDAAHYKRLSRKAAKARKAKSPND